MEEAFTNSASVKVFYSVLATLMFGIALSFFSIDYAKAGYGILVAPIIIFLFAFWLMISQFRRKIIISADSIISIGALGIKKIPAESVKGFEISSKTIVIESVFPGNTKIIINNYSDLENVKDLIKLIRENFTNLNTFTLNKGQEKLTNGVNPVHTTEDRKKLILAKLISIAYNLFGIIGCIAFLFWDYKLAVFSLLLYPLVGILVMWFSNGLISLFPANRESFSGSIIIGFVMPAALMLVNVVRDYQVYQFQNIWMPMLIGVLFVLFFLYKIGINRAWSKIGQMFLMLIISFFYVFISVVVINCKFDDSKPELIYTTIESAYITRNKGFDYVLYLKPWEEQGSPGSVEVSSKIYYRHPVGSNITVNLKHGLFNIPWFTVSN